MTAIAARKAANARGILWMLAAVVLLTAMFAVIRAMAQELPPFVVALMRTSSALMFLAPFVLRHGTLATKRPFGHFLRALFGISSFACIVWALKYLILADATAISFTAPFWSFILAVAFLRERIVALRLVATVAGFAGILLIAKPTGAVEPAMLFAIASAVLTAFAMITMKSLAATEPAERIVFYFFFVGTLLLLPLALADWQTPDARQLAWLIGAGLAGVIGQFCLTRAYAAAEVTAIQPLDFLRLPFAGVLGLAIFDEVPDLWSVAGAVVIIAAALMIARRETR